MLQDLRLQAIGVLVFVDQYGVKAVPNALACRGVGQQGQPVEQQIVVVEDRGQLLAFGVQSVELRNSARYGWHQA